MSSRDPGPPEEPLPSYFHSFLDPAYRRDVGALGLLRVLDKTRTELQAHERVLVSEARRDGASWSEIGEALHMSKQSAHRAFRNVDPQRDDD